MPTPAHSSGKSSRPVPHPTSMFAQGRPLVQMALKVSRVIGTALAQFGGMGSRPCAGALGIWASSTAAHKARPPAPAPPWTPAKGRLPPCQN